MIIVAPYGDREVIQYVQGATKLPDGVTRGYAAEESIKLAASVGGLADFFFLPKVVHQGRSNTEIGDGVIVAHGMAAVIQSKARGDEVTDDADKESRWLDKNIKKALKQAKGSAKQLSSCRRRMTNARQRSVLVDGTALRWFGVVVIDHPYVPSGYIPSLDDSGDLPCLVMLRRDWEYLFDHLRSTRAVLMYIRRLAGIESVLGDEPARYTALAISDEQCNPPEPLTGVRALSEAFEAHPISPLKSVGNADLFFRQMLEDVACPDTTLDEWDRIRMLMCLDTLPALTRVDLSTFVSSFLQSAEGLPAGQSLSITRLFIPGDGSTPIVFMAMTGDVEVSQWQLQRRTRLLSYDHAQSLDRKEQVAVGVLFTPTYDRAKPLHTHTVFIDGDSGLDDDQASEIRKCFEQYRIGVLSVPRESDRLG